MRPDDSTLASARTAPQTTSEFEALSTIIASLQALDQEARQRILHSVATFLRIGTTPHLEAPSPRPQGGVTEHLPGRVEYAPFSENAQISVKDFLLEKQPRTDVERIACLAYYLTHYRATPHFKTVDLSFLNTEAAQPKFANAANSANNAVKMGYLVPSLKGQRQLSAAGERFVRALPDREAARAALESLRRRPRARRSGRRAQSATEEQ